ncbi:MAG: hypothetical protein ABFD86_06885 [Bryobacteraceae bacterium]
MDQSIHDLVAATITELGLPAPDDIIQTILMKDRYFVGWKFRFDGGYVILRASDSTIEFYDEQRKLLKKVTSETETGAAA